MPADDAAQITIRTAGQHPALVHLTAVPTRPLDAEAGFRRFHEAVAAELRRRDVAVLQEKLFAAGPAMDALAAARDEAWAAHGRPLDTPPTRIVYRPCEGGQLAGLQLTGVLGSAPAGGSVTTLFDGDTPVGRELRIGPRRFAWLADLHAPPAATGDAHASLVGMFERMSALLERFEYRYVDVARTWIYVDRLLDWYDELNRVRTALFERVGVLGPRGTGILPASTGIQGAHPDGAGCFLDVLAIADDGGERAFAPMDSPAQGEAREYGSSFSRGMQVAMADHRLLLVSGTASIDEAGCTIHVGDPAAQLKATYGVVERLLGHAGTGFEGVVGGVLFFKDEPTYRAWQRLRADGELAALPGIAVYGDVCRHDLLFELETTAVT